MEVWLAILSELHKILFVVLIVILVVRPLSDYFTIGFDDSDSKSRKERSGFKVYTDFKTGRQYLVTSDGTVIPRLDTDNNQMIIEKE